MKWTRVCGWVVLLVAFAVAASAQTATPTRTATRTPTATPTHTVVNIAVTGPATATTGSTIEILITLVPNGFSICQGSAFLQFDPQYLQFLDGQNSHPPWSSTSPFNVEPAVHQAGVVSMNVGASTAISTEVLIATLHFRTLLAGTGGLSFMFVTGIQETAFYASNCTTKLVTVPMTHYRDQAALQAVTIVDPTPTDTPTPTTTPGPSPFSSHRTVPGNELPFTFWTAQDTAGTVLDFHAAPYKYCLCAVHLDSGDGSAVAFEDGHGTVMYATKTTSDLYLGKYGPCFDGPATFVGTGHVAVCWYDTGNAQ